MNHTENDRYWQKINFWPFAKWLKMYSFFRICILRLQKVLLWPKKLFLEKYQYGIKKRRILCWFRICWCWLSEMPLTKVKSKKLQKNAQKQKYSKSHSFLALTFFRSICLSRHQLIWNQHKILRFFDTHIDIFQEKSFWGHNSNIYHSPFDSH